MNRIRDILNEIKWKEQEDLSNVDIYYVHRGAIHDTKIIKGTDIIHIHKTFIETAEAMIPHHRIFRITYKDTVLFQRDNKT